MAFAFSDPLYPIADAAGGRDVVALAEAILAGGATLLQLRAKDVATAELVALAREIKRRADAAGALLIVNDRADVARLVDAAGVHLGQDDLPPAAARAILGANALIGLSTHSPDQAAAAVRRGAIDYLAFGPIYPTASKRAADPAQGLGALAAVRARCRLPLVAIGGIDASNVAAVLAAGADAVAVIGAIAGAADPAAALRALRRAAQRP
jgi:thiamine-phosphate pyrophosphorylase